MVKKLITVFALLGLVWVCSAFNGGFLQHRRTVSRGAAGGGGSGDACSGCTNETYEGTGTVLAGWVYGDGATAAVTNIDYATAPAPLIGSQSLLLKNANGGSASTYINVANSTEVWLRWTMVITNNIVNAMRIMYIADNVFAQQASVEIRSSGLRIVVGTANATTVNTLTAGTQYYCWAHYKKGTGANAVGDIEFQTTKTRVGSGNGFAQTTSGSTTANAQQIGPFVIDADFGSGILGCIYDNFSISVTGQIGDFP